MKHQFLDFGAALMLHNNGDEIDYPSVGHDSSRHSPISPQIKDRAGTVANREVHPFELEPGLISKTGPRKEEGKEPAFSAALKHYKAQKAAFKQAESSLFALFKSKKGRSRSRKGRQTIHHENSLKQLSDRRHKEG